MRWLIALWLLGILIGCGDDPVDGPPDARTADAARADGGSAPDAGDDSGTPPDAGGARDAGPPPPCDFDDPRPPPDGADVLWPAVLSATGTDTLGGHGHDDGHGPVGFCPGTPVDGEPYYRVVAVGFETDEDLDGDGEGDPLPVDFWRDAATFDGVGESAGRINVYVDVVDETGTRLNRDSAPELRLRRTIHDGPTDLLPLDIKPENELQTNFPMTGGPRYGIEVDGASDRIVNMRLPVNHHVTFAVIFERVAP